MLKLPFPYESTTATNFGDFCKNPVVSLKKTVVLLVGFVGFLYTFVHWWFICFLVNENKMADEALSEALPAKPVSRPLRMADLFGDEEPEKIDNRRDKGGEGIPNNRDQREYSHTQKIKP